MIVRTAPREEGMINLTHKEIYDAPHDLIVTVKFYDHDEQHELSSLEVLEDQVWQPTPMACNVTKGL